MAQHGTRVAGVAFGGEVAQQQSSGSRTLGRGLAVIHAIGARTEGATVAELCQATGLDRAVVHRLLGTLRDAGFVTRDDRTRRFRLGVMLVELGGQAARQLEVRRVAQTALRVLADGTRESACLAVRHDAGVIVVDRVEAAGGAGRLPLPVGTRIPLERSAYGRVVIALLDDRTVGGRMGATELATVRERGYDVGTGDVEPGLVEVAAPILDPCHEPVAALGVVAPIARLPDPARLGPRVRTVAHEVSRRLAASG